MEEPQIGEQLVLQTLDERAKVAMRAAYISHGYADENGDPIKEKVADVLFGPVSRAVAENKGDRYKVMLSRRKLMEIAFPNVPGPESFGDQDDSELAGATYDLVNGQVWDIVSASPKGLVQSRLNGDHGLVLVRLTPQRRGEEWGVYVTRDYASLKEDVILPTKKKQEARARSDAALAVMLMERIPEDAKKFQREFVTGLQTGANIAKEITKSTLSSLEAGDDD